MILFYRGTEFSGVRIATFYGMKRTSLSIVLGLALALIARPVDAKSGFGHAVTSGKGISHSSMRETVISAKGSHAKSKAVTAKGKNYNMPVDSHVGESGSCGYESWFWRNMAGC